MFKAILVFTVFILGQVVSGQQYKDIPYLQDFAFKYSLPDSAGTDLLQVRSDRNGAIQILSSSGILQPWKEKLVSDELYPFLKDLKIISIERYQDQFVYLTPKAVFSNSWAGKLFITHDMPDCSLFKMGKNFSFLLAGNSRIAYYDGGIKKWDAGFTGSAPEEIIYDAPANRFIVLSGNRIYTFDPVQRTLTKVHSGKDITSIALTQDHRLLIAGTTDGIYPLDCKTFAPAGKPDHTLPATNITCIREINGRLWFGSSHGAFLLRDDGKYDYYASRRWLVDDHVLALSPGPDNSVLVLTEKGLSRIVFSKMTLAEKADYFQRIQRLRHIRYGFSAETRLLVPGDLSTAVLHDTDNDGLWTSMYLAGELFRYAATRSEDALQNAYEAFEAMERLTGISGIPGFPARTYERDGYQSSDLDPSIPEDKKIWRLTEDGRWRWKSTTSSDESCGHFFVYALFAELVPDQAWKERAIHQIKIEMDHIIDHNWYLVTWNGTITQWGRWNPEYVNHFSVHTGDRRLNSTLIIAFLQTAYHFTGEERYKEKAYELMDKYGYLDNILRPASVIGFVKGEPLSDGWNHSDDEMYFLTVPALVKYAFTDSLRQKYLETVTTHWEIEKSEKNPLWNYIYALVSGQNKDAGASVWWLKEYPMDLVSWTVDNHERHDLVRIKPNFRNQEYTEVLPPDECPLHLHNGAYRNNGGNGGREEYPPYVWLLPYWLGRYVGAITPPGQ